MKRALVFLAITFGITYAYDFLVVYPIAEGIAAMCAWCTVLAIFLSYHPHRLHVCRGHRARGRERHD